MEKAALFWSGGKDSAFALYQVQQQRKFEIEFLVTTLNEDYRRISMHGIREELLDKQARSIGLPLYKMWVPDNPDNISYEKVLVQTFGHLKDTGVTTVVFGDIFLEDLRIYRELLAKKAGLNAYFPLWGQNTRNIIQDFLNKGFRTITCAIGTKYLSKDFLGKEIDTDFLAQLPSDVDPCGENGEYHTFCFDGPVFSRPITFELGQEKYTPLEIKTSEDVRQLGFWFVDLVSVS